MNLMLDQINYKYLLSLLACNILWLSYCTYGPSQALYALNFLRVAVCSAYVLIYLYAKSKLKPIEPYLKELLVCLSLACIFSYFLSPNHTLNLALTLNMTLFVFQFN
jgi:hypothetical protein